MDSSENTSGDRMSTDAYSLVFGPVPSRRLGRSIGINNIPPKICTYACVYCQVGNTRTMQVNRDTFYPVDRIVRSVENRVEEVRDRGEHIDYLTFVPDGEPTLDKNIGEEIVKLKPLGSKTAVITNATLLWREDVRRDLAGADWVSVKVDAVNPETWRAVNRPHKRLRLEEVQDGIRVFARSFSGCLTTETMLIAGINDRRDELEGVARFIEELNPSKSYLSIPTRPPAKQGIRAAPEQSVAMAYQIFTGRGLATECLIGYEGNEFASSGNIEDDILGIAAVHPIREDGVEELVRKSHADWSHIRKLLDEKRLVEIEFGGKKFYLRKPVDPGNRRPTR